MGDFHLFGVSAMMIFWWILIIAVILFVIRMMMSKQEETQPDRKFESPLEALKHRYAQGEITKEEFDKRSEEIKET